MRTKKNTSSGRSSLEKRADLFFGELGEEILAGLYHLVDQLSNFFYGVDAADDAQTLDVWYSKDAREFRIAAGFSMAAQIARPDLVAAVKNS